MAFYSLNASPWVYPFALVGIALSVAIALYAGYITPKDVLSPALAIFGTFFGATFAFRLTEAKEAKKLSETRREALNRTLFILIRQANAVDQLARDYENYKTPFERAFNMPAFQPDLRQVGDARLLVQVVHGLVVICAQSHQVVRFVSSTKRPRDDVMDVQAGLLRAVAALRLAVFD